MQTQVYALGDSARLPGSAAGASEPEARHRHVWEDLDEICPSGHVNFGNDDLDLPIHPVNGIPQHTLCRCNSLQHLTKDHNLYALQNRV